MKIVDRKTFLAIEGEVVYSKHSPIDLDGLYIKCGNAGDNDFIALDIAGAVACDSSEEYFDILSSAEKTGASVRFDFECAARDGLFDGGQLFAVWDREDVVGLIDRLKAVIGENPAPQQVES